jgi:hypothetical protein
MYHIFMKMDERDYTAMWQDMPPIIARYINVIPFMKVPINKRSSWEVEAKCQQWLFLVLGL